MKRILWSVFILLLSSTVAIAQDTKEKQKELEETNVKRKAELEAKQKETETVNIKRKAERDALHRAGDNEEIIIKKKNDKDSRLVIEIKDGAITINGKPIDEYDDENVSVLRRTRPEVYYEVPGTRFRSMDLGGMEEGVRLFNDDALRYGNSAGAARVYTTNSNKAFLGVASEKTNEGVSITSVTAKSGAEKAGLKSGDIISKINEIKITNPEDLTKAIGKFKPEEKITITYKRNGKEVKATATLGKNNASDIAVVQGYPRAMGTIRTNPFESVEGFNYNFKTPEGLTVIGSPMRPRLGIKAQDTEDGKGVKVLDVAKESAAEKAGVKEGDIITHFDEKEINSADDLAETAMESKNKASVKVKLIRDGKSQDLEIKTPRKLKTANL